MCSKAKMLSKWAENLPSGLFIIVLKIKGTLSLEKPTSVAQLDARPTSRKHAYIILTPLNPTFI